MNPIPNNPQQGSYYSRQQPSYGSNPGQTPGRGGSTPVRGGSVPGRGTSTYSQLFRPTYQGGSGGSSPVGQGGYQGYQANPPVNPQQGAAPNSQYSIDRGTSAIPGVGNPDPGAGAPPAVLNPYTSVGAKLKEHMRGVANTNSQQYQPLRGPSNPGVATFPGAPQQGVPRQGGVPQQGVPRQGGVPQGVPQGIPQGVPRQGVPPQGVPPQGIPRQGGVPPQGIPQGVPRQGGVPQGVPPQGIPQGVPRQGVPPQGVPPQGIPQGVPRQGVPPQGVPRQGVPQGVFPGTGPGYDNRDPSQQQLPGGGPVPGGNEGQGNRVFNRPQYMWFESGRMTDCSVSCGGGKY